MPGLANWILLFQSTLSSRRATVNLILRLQATDISIHALLTESDDFPRRLHPGRSNFNPRSPHGERPSPGSSPGPLPNFNPRSPHGERLANPCVLSSYLTISIHALLTESDMAFSTWDIGLHGFQSTLSSRRATAAVNLHFRRGAISIHALLTESDKPAPWRHPYLEAISIHALLTESDTQSSGMDISKSPISIHALLTESDCIKTGQIDADRLFQSTLSSRRATDYAELSDWAAVFQSTLSSRRATANTTKLALSFLSKVPILGWEKSKKAKGSANARGSFPVYGKNKVRIPWGDFECFRFAPIK